MKSLILFALLIPGIASAGSALDSYVNNMNMAVQASESFNRAAQQYEAQQYAIAEMQRRQALIEQARQAQIEQIKQEQRDQIMREIERLKKAYARAKDDQTKEAIELKINRLIAKFEEI